MFIFKRNPALYLAQTSKLPKAVYDHASFASQVLALPPSYKMREVKAIATPPARQRRYEGNEQGMDGGPRRHPQEEAHGKRLVFSKSGSMPEGLQIGSMFKRFLSPAGF
jgi:hypothetical protein